MWPQGSEESIRWQISELKDQLKQVTNDYMNILDRGLKAVMLDPVQFVEFANHGVYTDEEPLDLVENVNGTELALQTFLVSESLGKNGWYILPDAVQERDQFDAAFVTKTCDSHSGTIHGCTEPYPTKK